MGRPKKQTVEFYPHFVGGSRRTIFILETNWGNNGYAVWFKLLEILGNSDGHFYDLTVCGNLEYLVSYMKCDEETVNKILDMLANLGNIDKELWKSRRIIWCQALVDNLKSVYDKRTTLMPVKPFSGENIPENPVETQNAGDNGENTGETPPDPAKPSPKGKNKGKKKTAEAEPPKVQYADNVKMTEDEYEKLVQRYGLENARRMIEKLDNAKGAKGYSYKSDYRAILNWVADEIMGTSKGGTGSGGNETHKGNPPANNGAGDFRPSGGFRKP